MKGIFETTIDERMVEGQSTSKIMPPIVDKDIKIKEALNCFSDKPLVQ